MHEGSRHTDFIQNKTREPFHKAFGTQVEASLRKKISPSKCEVLRQFNITDFLSGVKQTVHKEWEKTMLEMVGSEDFIANIGPGTRFVIEQAIADQSLQKMLENDRYGILQILRLNGEPDCWKAFVSAMSKRERMNSVLALVMLNKYESKEILRQTGFSKSELVHFLELSRDMQEVIDQAYLRQMTIFEEGGPKKENPPKINEINGSEHFYIFPDKKNGANVAHAYKKMIPEVNKLAKIWRYHADRIEKDSSLPKSYKKLPIYLRKIADLITSDETSFSKVDNKWESISKECARLVENGCPLIVNPWGFSGEGEHVDVEFIPGLKHRDQELVKNTIKITENLDKYSKEQGIPKSLALPVIFYQSMSINGSHLASPSSAIVGDGYISFNEAQNTKIANEAYENYYKKIIGGQTSKKRFAYGRGITTLAHEQGHLFRIYVKRLGQGLSQNKLEELKADTLGAFYFSDENKRTQKENREYVEQYIVNYIEDIKKYQESKKHQQAPDTSSWYAFSGLTIINQFFKSEAIKIENGKVVIVDAKKGIETMASLGREISKLYGTKTFRAQEVEAYVHELEENYKNNQNIKDFLELIE
jgi:hypothetical protein